MGALRLCAAAALLIAAGAGVAAFATPGRSPGEAGRIEPLAPMNEARSDQSAVELKDGSVLVAGGLIGSSATTASAEVFDPAAKRFQPVGAMRSPRAGAAAALLPDGRVLIAGGWTGHGPTASAEIYDRGQVVRLASGDVLVSGGDPQAELFDPVTGRFRTVPGGLGLARHFGTATPLRDGSVLILGGYGDDVQHSRSAVIYRPT